LKNAADEDADIWAAFRQIQTYKEQIPSLFTYNAVAVISDGLEHASGRSCRYRAFMPGEPWRAKQSAPVSVTQLEVLLRGVFEKRRSSISSGITSCSRMKARASSQEVAGYHQFHAVRIAVEETIRASSVADNCANRAVAILPSTSPAAPLGTGALV